MYARQTGLPSGLAGLTLNGRHPTSLNRMRHVEPSSVMALK
jgi:hypothetical protein